ncbi:AzlD domain-containing protein [Bacillus aquiflavi]|uniref:AzlD domain-containing protein n=1 Tax=Bacillus aquiflavi TaxID=2672567 RepID=A0A6B3VUY4_9BACI|nr:AzlD domain-containing protein [Bacillus aquiflavi]MBA4535699.1 AzlD domain-containing protein [Bacillus aquiflavi]NEY80075.1 AzlD domain-containing protein [Bacillus aquiflavi]UAC49004.1 AzlD domain-containing protein [Bacillus aquiflavi]
MSKEIVLMIIGMALVTYIPRMLPFVLFKDKELPLFVQGILNNVPYATLGALIFPGILFMNGVDIWYGVIGAATAFGLAYAGASIMIVVIGAIAVLTVYSYFI